MHHKLVYVSNRLAVTAIFLTEVAVAAPAALDGTWTTPFETRFGGISTQNSLTVLDGKTLQFGARVHVKSPLFGNLAELYTLTSGYEIFDRPVDAAQTIFPIDFTFIKIEQTPLNEETAVKNNSDAQCGFTDWKVGVAKDITGIKCDEHDEHTMKPGEKLYSIFQIQGDTLLLGTEPGDSPETRSKMLDTKDIYTKIEE